MAYIGPAPNPGQNREVDDISSGFNGGTASFTLQVNGQNVSPGSANAIIVSLGGVIQNPGTDYTVAASTITFTTNPASGLSFFGLVLGQQVDIQSVAESASIVSPTLSGPTVTGDLSIADKIVHTGDTNTAIRFSAADTVAIETNGSNRFHITSAGSVGVSTTSPVAQTLAGGTAITPVLDLKGVTQNNTSGILQLTRKDNPTQGSCIYSSGDDAGLTMRNTDGNGMGFYNGTTLAFRINPSGFVAIGTSSPNTSFRTKIQEDTSGNGVLILDRTSNIDGNFRSMVSFDRSGTQVGTITCSNSATQFNTSSDHRLKENVVTMSNATDRLKQLQPKRFNFIINPDITVDGFLAHEVQSVVPEAISGTKDETQDILYTEEDTIPSGKKVGDVKETVPKYQGIDQSKLVPLLTAALQEAITKIETLETKVAALEAA